jgi:endonuclease G
MGLASEASGGRRVVARQFGDSEASARFAASGPERAHVLRQIKAGLKPQQIDSPTRVQHYRQHKRIDLVESVGRPAANESARLAFEQVLNEPDFIPVRFLANGLERVRSVGCILANSSRIGTGFMVTPRLLLTNAHVIETKGEAGMCSVEFGYEEAVGGGSQRSNVFTFETDFFITSDKRALDYTLLSVKPRSANGAKLSEYDYIELVPTVGKALRGQYLNIVQHPAGRAKELVLRNNQLTAILANYLHYEADTEPGSSGAPVFNDLWEVVCLHHRAVPADMRGDVIYARDGQPWDGQDRGDVDWIGNEGVRISRIIRDVWRQAEDLGLASQLANFPKPVNVPDDTEETIVMDDKDARDLRKPEPRKPDKIEKLSGGAGVTTSISASGGEITIEIPLRVTVSLGDVTQVRSAPPGKRAQPAAPPETDATPQSLARAARRALEEFHTRTYYDQAKDEVDVAEYYDGIDSDDASLLSRLSDLIEQTHSTRFKYNVARIQHLYGWVDLQRNKKVRSIYSDTEYDPKKFVDEDLTIERRHEAVITERKRYESSLTDEAIDTFRMMLEASDPFNCEHVVPQSWFNKESVKQGDLHHLYSCEANCNSFRSNHEYADFGTFDLADEAVRQKCGDLQSGEFEPYMGKGKVARATLYFMIRYPGITDAHYEAEKIRTLIDWHKRYSVTEHEQHRNQAIFELQGNRNPLIDHAEWAEQIFGQ